MGNKYPFPKLDLHLHLDGAIDPRTLMELADERHISHGARSFEEFYPLAVYGPDCSSVNDFLARFDLPTKVLQDRDSLKRIARELVVRSADQDLAYIEMRFAPQLHTQNGLSQEDAAEAVLAGIAEGLSLRPGIGVGLILCCMVLGPASLNREANIKTVELTSKLLGSAVCAVDLAGAEGVAPFEDFGYVFELAKELRVPTTCHAGDSQDADTVRTALLDFGSLRIGHGHHIADDPELCRLAAELGAALEICLTSNIQCETQPSFELHPAKKLLDMGIGVTLNTDNPIISMTSIEQEYDVALARCGFNARDLIKANINSVRASFMPNRKKAELLSELNRYL